MTDMKDHLDSGARFGPKVSNLTVSSVVVLALVLSVIVALLVTHLVVASPNDRIGYLGYGRAGVSGDGGYVVGSPFSVMTPPLVNLGHAPLTLESVNLVATGCPTTIVSSALYKFNGAGVEFGPGSDPPSRWSAFGLRARAGPLRGKVLRPGTERTPGFKDILTLHVLRPGAVLIAGFKVKYETEGSQRTQLLLVPQVYLPYLRGEARKNADLNLQSHVLSSLRISRQGTVSARPCEYIHS
jgi:hypothetical protein